jgi:hypothetical protein
MLRQHNGSPGRSSTTGLAQVFFFFFPFFFFSFLCSGGASLVYGTSSGIVDPSCLLGYSNCTCNGGVCAIDFCDDVDTSLEVPPRGFNMFGYYTFTNSSCQTITGFFSSHLGRCVLAFNASGFPNSVFVTCGSRYEWQKYVGRVCAFGSTSDFFSLGNTVCAISLLNSVAASAQSRCPAPTTAAWTTLPPVGTFPINSGSPTPAPNDGLTTGQIVGIVIGVVVIIILLILACIFIPGCASALLSCFG